MNWNSTRGVLAALLVTAMLVLAGCTGPTDGGNGTVAEGAAVTPTDVPDDVGENDTGAASVGDSAVSLTSGAVPTGGVS